MDWLETVQSVVSGPGKWVGGVFCAMGKMKSIASNHLYYRFKVVQVLFESFITLVLVSEHIL